MEFARSNSSDCEPSQSIHHTIVAFNRGSCLSEIRRIQSRGRRTSERISPYTMPALHHALDRRGGGREHDRGCSGDYGKQSSSRRIRFGSSAIRSGFVSRLQRRPWVVHYLRSAAHREGEVARRVVVEIVSEEDSISFRRQQAERAEIVLQPRLHLIARRQCPFRTNAVAEEDGGRTELLCYQGKIARSRREILGCGSTCRGERIVSCHPEFGIRKLGAATTLEDVRDQSGVEPRRHRLHFIVIVGNPVVGWVVQLAGCAVLRR